MARGDTTKGKACQDCGQPLHLDPNHICPVKPKTSPKEASTPATLEMREGEKQPEILRILREEMADCTRINSAEKTPDGKHEISFEVTDKKKWLEKLKTMLPQIGELYYLTYEPKDSGRKYEDEDVQAELVDLLGSEDADYYGTDKMYLVANDEKVEGFQALRNYTASDGRSVLYEVLTAVREDAQGKKIGEQLMRQLLTKETADAVVSVSLVPAAMKVAMRIAKESGNMAYFGGYRYGEKGNLPTEEERIALKPLYDVLTVQEWRPEFHTTAEVPEGYVPIEAECAMPPLEAKDIKFKPGDPLGETFEEMLKIQQGCPEGTTIFGLAVFERAKKE